MKKLLIVLGAPNGPLGELSQIAQDRLACALRFYNANSDCWIVCTGGFGQHFNTTDKPHFFYAVKYLTDNNVPASAFLECPPSSNTIEDFQMTRSLVWEEQPDVLVIITSDFHLARARALYTRIINYPKVIFVPASSSLPEAQLAPLVEHEARALKKLQENTL
ncbi:YdcF family protein [Chitinophaga varians]|uniref:YdcF family protein n=1 Tax=Chitinophaga varians TaxID=2202339 RepID=A0A847RY16_9BACT|nr:YdcF family protein [Chitinophaga varians]NLR67952.1 YdcF family protein [Chitinophaga varians]